MNSEFLPYGRHNINDEDIKSVIRVLESDYLTQGEVHIKFENSVSSKVGSSYCVSFNSATSALHIACMALDLKKGDYLWTTPITFVASANCARYCNAEVDFVDIEEKTGLMSPELLEEKLYRASKEGKLPKIVIPVHLAGASCNMPRIYELSKIYGFHIVEDASHAIGGSCNNYSVGSCKYSDITVFSLHPVKIITSAEGGLATTNSITLSKRMRTLASHGITKDQDDFVGKNFENWRYEQQELGFNYRLSDVHAALGVSQLERLEYFIDRRNNIANFYKNELSKLPIKTLDPYDYVRSTYHLFIVQLEDDFIDHHEYIFNYLRGNGIGVQLHYLPVHLQPYYTDLGFSKGYYPLSEKYSKKSFSLPIFPSLKEEDILKVITLIKEIFCKITS